MKVHKVKVDDDEFTPLVRGQRFHLMHPMKDAARGDLVILEERESHRERVFWITDVQDVEPTPVVSVLQARRPRSI